MLDYRAHTFIIAYRLRSFTRAAEELHITQPAVSQHIKQLEARAGCRLFETRGRAIHSTPAGDLLYRRLSVMANDEARIIDELRRLDSATAVPLRLGCTRTIADYVAPRLLAKHAQRHPEQTAHLRSANTHDLLISLEMGELDLALVEGPYDRSSFDGSVLSTEPYVAVASPRKAQSAQASEQLLGVFRVACSTRQGDACRRSTESTGFPCEGVARSLHAIDGAGAKTTCRVHALPHVGNNGMLLRIHDRAISHACEREPR